MPGRRRLPNPQRSRGESPVDNKLPPANSAIAVTARRPVIEVSPAALPVPISAKPLVMCLGPEDELEVLIRARYPILYVVSWEEERIERQLALMSTARNKKFYVWTYTQGIVRHGAAETQRTKGGTGSTTDPLAALDAVLQ